jgi:hypothetical protein
MVDPYSSNLGCRSVRFRSDTSSCLIVVSPRGINQTKETAGMNVFFYQSNDVSFPDKPLIKTVAILVS